MWAWQWPRGNAALAAPGGRSIPEADNDGKSALLLTALGVRLGAMSVLLAEAGIGIDRIIWDALMHGLNNP